MKSIFLPFAAFSVLLFFPKNHSAQAIFNKITDSPVVTTPGDSRSVNWVDIDNDNDLDLFISNGKSGGENNFLYKNDGTGKFSALTDSPIVQDGKPSDGATWADFDNDGDADCFVANWYNIDNLFYKNDGVVGGEVQFAQVLTGPLVTDGGFSETASWGDFDNDGWLDLYVTNSGGSLKNFLYKNMGDGSFTKITTGAAATDAATSRCVNWTDLDMDGDLDLFVTNENHENENLYRNDAGVLVKITTGPLVMAGGKTMSASWGDYDNDGFQDVFLANDQANDQLFHNDGGGNFTKITTGPLVASGGNSFGSQWADVNNDGWLDLFVTNAFWGGEWKNFLFLNNGDGSFTKNLTETVATDKGWSYGCAFGDMDRDGDLDLAVANCFNETQPDGLYENQSSANGNSWLEIELVGTVSNKSAIGAKVWLTAKIDGKTVLQLREVSAQSGHCGQNQLTVHFGLGKLDSLGPLKIEWPSGLEEIFDDFAANQFLKIVEGQGLISVKNPVAQQANLRVFQATPNPFSDSVSCLFELAKTNRLIIEVVDNQGVVVEKLADRNFPGGMGQIEWASKNTATGVYFLRFSSGGVVWARTVVKI